jgi:hypothetical protein
VFRNAHGSIIKTNRNYKTHNNTKKKEIIKHKINIKRIK